MLTFKVESVIDGNTFEVSPPWEFDGETGKLVQATGYDAPKSGKRAISVEQKLSVLMQNKDVELESPQGIENGRLLCEVYFHTFRALILQITYQSIKSTPTSQLRK